MSQLFVKICGITRPDQAEAIAALGVSALGFIAVPNTPRYLSPSAMAGWVGSLPVLKVGVFLDQDPHTITTWVEATGITAVQLHGQESPEDCHRLGELLPGIPRIKALRIRHLADLALASAYTGCVETLLLDAYHPQQAGGTGQTLNWSELAQGSLPLPWILAGGLNPDNIGQALSQVTPNGIDLSSGVEVKPGDKDLGKVQALLQHIRSQGWEIATALPPRIPLPTATS
ncbi:phosphoribosylanthranilate isomerase [Thermostichus vulcanus]|uniref:N-(5'-phosphoribosyl)anthranilate isomerase n=1 Tax=Thermostichus vulcanus str. 'Rupite' TaxID=2813851 RepID=A0ABT0CFA8_THEVL|nr:phosphoribosylanthranilate isomerase [Thermostichus vulcanus]MCJ2544409.1 phosphoribosylanthranilate isomerase [Thermostichus vulcanus str. 'Rupite']